MPTQAVETNPTQFHRSGPWKTVTKVTGVLRPDGRRVTFYPVGQPDTFFTQPGFLFFRGRKVTGFIVSNSDSDPGCDFRFIPDVSRRNGHIFDEFYE